MSKGMKVVVGLLAVAGAVMLGLMLLGLVQYFIIGIVLVAIGYGVIRALTNRRGTGIPLKRGAKPKPIKDKDLDRLLNKD